MKTTIVPLIGDPIHNLYQLGLKERTSYLALELRVRRLLSTVNLLGMGQDFLNRAKFLLKKKENSLFDKCIAAYAEGLGIDSARYYSFITLFELAAHYGQLYPELKGILPGCTSIFLKNTQGDICHGRLLDFPLVGVFDKAPRLYYWLPENGIPLMSYSCEGLAPLFFQGIHGSGMSFALHHKPGKTHHINGQSIFQILFEGLFEAKNLSDFKKELKKKITVTKWGILALDKSGQALVMDIDGPAQNIESFELNETSPLIFTNIPLHKDAAGFENFYKFSESRQKWLKEKILAKSHKFLLDNFTDVEDQKTKGWLHSAGTLSTIGAWEVNLTQGTVDVKEGDGALVLSDAILRVNLSNQNDISVLKPKSTESSFEKAWKRASMAQGYFDQGEQDLAYHELQMAQALCPHGVWKEIFSFYLAVWDFKFISNPKELGLIYKKVKNLRVPDLLKDQWLLLLMRFERRLDLNPTVHQEDVSSAVQELFRQERLSSKPMFATWMKLLYPRLEVLDVFSPHQSKQ
jgi:hypothetical protein